MDMETNVTRVDMAPDAIATLAKVSVDVCMYTPTLPDVVPPIVNPDIVSVTVAPEEMLTPAVVKTNDVVVVALDVNVKPAMLLAVVPTVGVQKAKKERGYVSVIVPPELRGEEGENPIVIGTLALPAMRSDGAITKVVACTCP
jgi:hypothetical protein